MRKVFLLVCLMMAALLAVSVVTAQDEDTVMIPLLEDGVTVDGEFDEDSSMQIYLFFGSEGDEVTITMQEADGSGLDPFLILLSVNGEVIAYNDDVDLDNGDLSSAIEEAELPADGRYVVVASTFGEFREPTGTITDAHGYTLTASGMSDPGELDPDVELVNNFSAEAEDGVVNISGTINLSAENPLAYIFFPAEEGQEISLTTSEASDSDEPLGDPLIYIFDAEGRRIAGSDDADGLFAATSVEAPDSGLYVAFVTSYLFWTAAEDPDAYLGVGDVNVELTVE